MNLFFDENLGEAKPTLLIFSLWERLLPPPTESAERDEAVGVTATKRVHLKNGT